jgi:hypothetical protein
LTCCIKRLSEKLNTFENQVNHSWKYDKEQG